MAKRGVWLVLALMVSFWGSTSLMGQTFKNVSIKAHGKPISYGELLNRCRAAEVIFFGELHDDSLCHLLERELLAALQADKVPIAVGMEMLETEDQTVLQEYMRGQATYAQFETSASLWGNWEADYKPILDFCKANQVPLLATNVPRRYASLVARRGLQALDSLTTEAKAWMAPLPLQVPYGQASYKAMRTMMGGHGDANDEVANRFVAAQALKDATMAHSISKMRGKGSRYLHINGSFHSNYNEGILTYLKRLEPAVKTLTLSFVRAGTEDAQVTVLADVVLQYQGQKD
jgi:uncharacterized iron-regulated protein